VIAKIIWDDKRCPKNLQANRRKEFYKANVQKLLKKHGINYYSTYSVMKALSNNSTVRWRMIGGNSLLSRNYRWINLLPHLVSEYNARKHRTIGMRPFDVTPAIADKFLTTVYSRIKIAAPARFKVSDSVRMSKFKTMFEKGYTPNWTTEVFKITKVQKTNPVTYLLEDSCRIPVAGGFYEYELLILTCILSKKCCTKGSLCEMAGIWQFTQFMDTQK